MTLKDLAGVSKGYHTMVWGQGPDDLLPPEINLEIIFFIFFFIYL